MSTGARCVPKGNQACHKAHNRHGQLRKDLHRRRAFESSARWKCYHWKRHTHSRQWSRPGGTLAVFLGERVQVRKKGVLHAAKIAAFQRDYANGA